MASPDHPVNAASPIGPRVAVVTVAFRSNLVLPTFLASIPSASRHPVAIVIVDNDPGGSSLAAEYAEQVGARYIAAPTNPGYGGGMNLGVAHAPDSVEWVLVCNPDLELGEGLIDDLVAVGDNDDRIGTVGPAVLNIDRSVYPSARNVPSLRTGVGHALFVTLWQSNPWTARYRHDADTTMRQRDAGWLSGSCLLVRRSLFDELGGFDGGYFMYFEDVDLGYRAGRLGYRNVYVPTTSVIHTGAHATTTESSRMIRAHHASARRFLTRKYRGWYLWPVRAGLRAGLHVREWWVVRRSR